MARIKNGLISGKIGEVVYYQVRGEQFMRKKPQREKPSTEGELGGQNMLRVVNNWVKPLLEFVRIGFRNYHERYQGYTAAVSVVHREALQRDGDNFRVDPSKARLSHGILPLAENLQAQLLPDARVEFTWNPVGKPGSSPRDRIMLLAYNVEQQSAIPRTFGNIRYSGRDSLQLHQGTPGKYHLYAAFIAEDLSRQSDSVYLGEVEVG